MRNRRTSARAQLNIHIHPSQRITNASRLQKVTASLAEMGLFDRILIVAFAGSSREEVANLDNIRSVWWVPTRFVASRNRTADKSLMFFEWGVRVLQSLKTQSVACVNPHSLSCLPLAVAIKMWKRCHLVYDTHEIETEVEMSRGSRRLVYKVAERVLMPFVDSVVVVSEGAGSWYRQRYPQKPVHVIKNLPRADWRTSRRGEGLKARLGIPNDELLFLLMGTIARIRGVDLVLEVFTKLSKDRHVVFMGWGDAVDHVRDVAMHHSNIHVVDGVKPHEVTQVIQDVDVSFSLLENTCPNHYYALPNKVLESLSAGVPVIVSDFPDVGTLVRKYDCGWTTEVEASAVRRLVERLTSADVREKRENALAWAAANSWEQQDPDLLRVYRELGWASTGYQAAAGSLRR